MRATGHRRHFFRDHRGSKRAFRTQYQILQRRQHTSPADPSSLARRRDWACKFVNDMPA